MKFNVDEWVTYRQFPENPKGLLFDIIDRAVILEILPDKDFYDYRICIDDGTAKIKKVKEENLESI
jgi:hypothetical protein